MKWFGGSRWLSRWRERLKDSQVRSLSFAPTFGLASWRLSSAKTGAFFEANMAEKHETCAGPWVLGALEETAKTSINALSTDWNPRVRHVDGTPLFFRGFAPCPHCDQSMLLFSRVRGALVVEAVAIEDVMPLEREDVS